MGYQESYVRVKDSKDFNKLLDTIRKVGEDYYDQYGAYPVEVITLKKAIQGDLSYMCHPDKTYSFKAGEKFVYFTGERQIQRNVMALLNNKKLKGVEIYYTECFPSYDIFARENDEYTNEYATHEEFKWMDE